MPNHKSAEKRMRQNDKRRMRNKDTRSRVRTFVKKFETALASGELDQAAAALVKAESELKRAAAKGVIPNARASRKTGRMAVSLAKQQAQG